MGPETLSGLEEGKTSATKVANDRNSKMLPPFQSRCSTDDSVIQHSCRDQILVYERNSGEVKTYGLGTCQCLNNAGIVRNVERLQQVFAAQSSDKGEPDYA